MKNTLQLLSVALVAMVAYVTSQRLANTCDDAQAALAANAECTGANLQVTLYLHGVDDNLTRGNLTTYCSRTCRDLYLRILTDCINDEDVLDIQLQRSQASINLICCINGDQNCIEFLRSPQVVSLNAALDSGLCPFLDNDETCSSGCASVIENFITGGECCTRKLLEFENNHDDFNVTYDQLLSYCNLDPQSTPCDIIFINGTILVELRGLKVLLMEVSC